MADRLPSLPLFVDDYEGATTHLTLEEDGAYMRLLRLCWRTPKCTIPDDTEWIMRRLRVDRATYDRLIEPIITEFFKRARGRISQKRLLSEFEYATARQNRRKEAGKKGGSAKAAKTNEKEPSNARALLEQSQGIAVAPSPAQPSPKEKEEVPLPPEPETEPDYAFAGSTIKLNRPDFDAWQAAYHAIPDLAAELTSIDAWWRKQTPEKRKDWFVPTSSMLNRKHQEMLKASAAAVASGEPANFLDHLTQRRREEQAHRERQQQGVIT